jgi:hypothetical protein
MVAEKSTFEYYRRKLPKRVGPETSLVFSPVVPSVFPRLVFTDRTLRDEFNAARNALQAEYASERVTGQADAIRPSEMIPKQVEPE